MTSHRHRIACIISIMLLWCGSVPATAAAAAAPSTGPWSWSASARSWVVEQEVLERRTVQRGVGAALTRGELLAALARIQELRSADDLVPHSALITNRQPGTVLADAPAGSLRARSVALGWFAPRAGRFAPGAPVTSNEAAVAVAAMLGLRPEVRQLARSLRRELPQAQLVWGVAASHVVGRTLGLRHNVRDPWDAAELGPHEYLNVAHGAFMLRAARRVESWRLDEVRSLAAGFALPEVAPAQERVLRAAVRQLGQPYVWGGETEGEQTEGHGGFDCSGFVLRVVNGAGLPSVAYTPIAERTSMAQSDQPRRRRITREALRPGDLMFFGDRGPRSLPSENFHVGLYMGDGWFIHSSGSNAGVNITPLAGWWSERFSWGRRVLHTD